MMHIVPALWIACASLAIAGCGSRGGRSATSVEKIRSIENVNFSMAALSSGVMFAYNPLVDEHLFGTKYSTSAESKIRPLINEIKPPCSFAIFEADVSGSVILVGRENELMLYVNRISNIRPLSKQRRLSFKKRSPTLSSEALCGTEDKPLAA